MAQQQAQRIRRIRPSPRVTARVTSIGAVVKRADTSRQMSPEDEFVTGAATLFATPITPPYDPYALARIIEQSSMLKQCIAAYVTNVALCGYDVVPVMDTIEADQEEKDALQSFIECANSEESLSTVMSKVDEDYESFGYGFMEVIRDIRGRISLLRHCPAIHTRLMPKDEEAVPVRYNIRRGSRISTVTEYRSFRRYVQIINGKVRYFKEFGDTRRMDFETGKFEDARHPVPETLAASEILHFRQNSPDSYGVPRWINQLPNVLGSREAEEVNLRYFEDNTVPPMLLSVAGGRLTGESFRQLQAMLMAEGLGRERQHKMLLIEAVPERESLDDKGSVSLKVDKLTDSRQGDGLFKLYDEGNQAKIRSSFRLPPVAVGLSQDVTFATANVSAFIAETQVYLPQRRIFDEVLNKKLIQGPSGLGLRTCMLRSQVPAITNPQELIKSLTSLNTMGAVTPRSALKVANRVLEIEIPEYPKQGEEGYEEWMDQPIVFVTQGKATQAEQALKSQENKDIENDGDVTMRRPKNGQQ